MQRAMLTMDSEVDVSYVEMSNKYAITKTAYFKLLIGSAVSVVLLLCTLFLCIGIAVNCKGQSSAVGADIPTSAAQSETDREYYNAVADAGTPVNGCRSWRPVQPSDRCDGLAGLCGVSRATIFCQNPFLNNGAACADLRRHVGRNVCCKTTETVLAPIRGNMKFRIKLTNTSQCITPSSTANLASLKMADCTMTSYSEKNNLFQWFDRAYQCHDGSLLKLNHTAMSNVASDVPRCLDVEGASLTHSTNVLQFDCHGRANQDWMWLGQGPIRVRDNSALCLSYQRYRGNEFALVVCQGSQTLGTDWTMEIQ